MTNSTGNRSPKLGPTGKRLDYISWHQHHMYMARMLAEMCNSKVESASGCYIVDQEHYQIASGFSGENAAATCNHAVSVALLKLENKKLTRKDCILYTTELPKCSECLEKARKLKIAKIWYWSNGEEEKSIESGIPCEKYIPTRTIQIDFHGN